MSNRKNALRETTKVNLEVVKEAEYTIKNWQDKLITSDECYKTLKNLFFSDFKEEQAYSEENISKELLGK